jgi:hypothetical protein
MAAPSAAAIAPHLSELKPGSFIYRVGGALEPEICRELIRRFEEKPDQQYTGRMGMTGAVVPEMKRTTDLRISGREDWKDLDRALFASLSAALGALSAAHPFFRSNRFRDLGYNLQRYRPGEYYEWHIDSGPGEFSQRQLVALWYLNDVPAPGGETQFLLQDIAVAPREGELVLFPPFWTHPHRAAPVHNGVKYIATTWVCFESQP